MRTLLFLTLRVFSLFFIILLIQYFFVIVIVAAVSLFANERLS